MSELHKMGFHDTVLLLEPAEGKEAEVVKAAIRGGFIPGSYVNAIIKGLQEGHWIVGVQPPLGTAMIAIQIMERCGGIGAELLPAQKLRDPSPLSDALGIPVLTSVRPNPQLARSDWSLSSFLGLGLLSRKGTPLSSLLGLKTLTKEKKKTSSFGLPLLSNKAAPLSSMFGLKTLTKAKKKTSSFGLPLLSRNPAPLSSLFGLRILSKRKNDDDSAN
ncbi:MAG: hypothetical protein AAGF11_26445 [Myxococcota bacterium]